MVFLVSILTSLLNMVLDDSPHDHSYSVQKQKYSCHHKHTRHKQWHCLLSKLLPIVIILKNQEKVGLLYAKTVVLKTAMSSSVLKAVIKGIPFSCAPLQFSVLCLCPKLRRSKDLNFAGRTRAQTPCALEKSTFFQSRQRAHLLVSRLPARLCTLLHVWLTR